jgi:hypothetical protein
LKACFSRENKLRLPQATYCKGLFTARWNCRNRRSGRSKPTERYCSREHDRVERVGETF